jgi:hypothetical protein
VKLQSLEEARAQLEQMELYAMRAPGPWSVGQVLVHCAQSLEYALTGFPENKPRLFRATVGKLALAIFLLRGRLSHDRAAAIPGAPDLLPTETEPALARLFAAIDAFRAADRFAEHFAYGAVDKARYDRVQAMHIADHLSSLQLDFSWEGVVLRAPAELAWQADRDAVAKGSERHLMNPAPRLVVSGQFMARQSVYAAAVRDFAFTTGKSPMIVVRDGDTELVRVTTDRAHADYKALVIGMSISYATPPEMPPVPADETRRDGGSFSADIGFYLRRPAEPRELCIHAEFASLRSNEVRVRLLP